MNINQESALIFILKAMWKKQNTLGESNSKFYDWLKENNLVEQDSNKEKVYVRENVALTSVQIDELKKFYTSDEIDNFYDKLSHYKSSKGKRYKSDYGAIQTWVIESVLGAKRRTPINQHVKHWNEE